MLYAERVTRFIVVTEAYQESGSWDRLTHETRDPETMQPFSLDAARRYAAEYNAKLQTTTWRKRVTVS